ncbi:MAG: HAD family hydrolase [Gemmatales bacterium]|nr:HAD family hydrolase [Gemmatales bacterium]MDW8387164.1 HAD family hydrolase [Gemmatales bacterium]
MMRFCLFDIDGTLLRSGGAGKAAMEASLVEEFGLERVEAQIPFSGRTDRAISRDLLSAHRIEPHDDHIARLLRGYLDRLPDCLRAYHGKVLPGVCELLDALAGHDRVGIGLLTGNIREGARLKLEHFGIFHYFGFGAYGDEHLDRDDVARAAWAEVRRLDPACRPEDVWIIGDTPLDVRCARAIGARVVAVATGWHSGEELRLAEPDLLLPDLAEVDFLIGRLLEA